MGEDLEDGHRITISPPIVTRCHPGDSVRPEASTVDLETLGEKMKTCGQCPLSRYRRNVVVGDIGRTEGVCFIGEAPGEHEDLQARPFVGRSGKLLDRMLGEIGLSRRQVSVLNIVKCRPPNNRKPSPDEIKRCAPMWLEPQLDLLRPKVIVALGAVALNYFFPKARISRSVAQVMTLDNGTKVFPLFHPAYILRNGNYDLYQLHFQKLAELLGSGDEQEEKGESEQTTNEQMTLDDFF